jgi:hypothetical protein
VDVTTKQALPPEVYARVFENIPEGGQILEELVARFGRNPYVKGGLEADRQTAFNAGALEVVNFILRRIEQAQGGDHD